MKLTLHKYAGLALLVLPVCRLVCMAKPNVPILEV
jgi:cytochrome b561